MFSVFHDTDDACLQQPKLVETRQEKRRERASIIYFRSSSIRSRVSILSVGFSSLEVTVAIFTFFVWHIKSQLKEKESVECISRLGGCFLRILYFAQASDCKCRLSSGSSIPVASFISYQYRGKSNEKKSLL